MATNTATSPYWNPGVYADPYGQSWGNTQYGQQTKEQAPQAAYYRYGVEQGIPDDGSAFSRWFQQQYGDVYRGYQSATIDNPYLMIDPYLQSTGGYADWLKRFQDNAPQLRGEDQSAAGANQLRWISR